MPSEQGGTDMTEDENNWDALAEKQLASVKRDMRVSLEDAAVRATHKVMAELGEERNFCPRCGKRTADPTTIHTCTPPKDAR